jgi:predicted P-loop ATPase
MAWTNVDSFCSQQFQRQPLDSGSGPGVQDATDEEIEAEVNTTLWLGIWNPAQENGLPKCGVSNAEIFLRNHFKGKTVRYNEFTRLVEADGAAIRDGEMAELHRRLEVVTEQTKWAQAHLDKAILILSRSSSKYHPVREYLTGLTWDGTDRIANLVGSVEENSALKIVEPLGIHQRYLECFFLSAVARVMQPGCKVDTALILQGPQGARKSSFFRYLVPVEAWFSDDMGALENKDAGLSVHHAWIIEWAELESVRRSNVGAVKSFLTRQVDKFRPPYGRVTEDFARASVICGTTNEEQFLQDSTGNRRYMVIPVRHIDTNAIARDRDQLWAEAAYRFRCGEPWHLTGEEMAVQALKNTELVSEDPWEEVIREWLPKSDLVTSCFQVTLEKLLGQCLQIPAERRTKGMQVRAGQVMSGLGWMRRKEQTAGKRQSIYTAPENWPENV